MKTILIAPLDWGLGHASRDIPIIKKLIDEGNKLIVASDNYPAELLKKEFPNTKHIKLEGTQIKYSTKGFITLKILFQIPKFVLGIRKEHKKLQEIIQKYKIDIVISDNRYGLYSKLVKSIFITHQISIQLPKPFKFLEYLIYKLHLHFINKFDKCLIPDFENKNNISGNLSHKYSKPKNAEFIGILSRFSYQKLKIEKKYKLIAIISGAEPQRTLFFNKIKNQVIELGIKTLIVEGKPGKFSSQKKENTEIVNHLSAEELQKAILQSKVVICRSGYSSIMDLVSLKKSAILVPTPNQTEQEYLAEYLSQKKYFLACKQDTLNLQIAINTFLEEKYKVFDFKSKSFLGEFVSSLKNL